MTAWRSCRGKDALRRLLACAQHIEAAIVIVVGIFLAAVAQSVGTWSFVTARALGLMLDARNGRGSDRAADDAAFRGEELCGCWHIALFYLCSVKDSFVSLIFCVCSCW